MYVVACGYVFFNQRSFMFPIPSDMRGQSVGQTGEDIEIETPDGERLYARYVAAPENRPTVLYFHGNGMQVAWEEPRANQFVGSGFGILLVEYRGYPGSTGTPSERGLLTDGLAAYDWLRARGVQDIVVNAHSLGTGVGAYVASQRPVAAVSLEAPYDSLVAIASAAYPIFPVSLLMRDKFQTENWVRDIGAPLMIIHGEKDTVIPIERGRALFDKAVGPKDLVVLKSAGHNDLILHGSTKKTISFFNEVLDG